MSDEKCHCESCKRTPLFDSLEKKATPEEAEALNWLWDAMEDASNDLGCANVKVELLSKVNAQLKSELDGVSDSLCGLRDEIKPLARAILNASVMWNGRTLCYEIDRAGWKDIWRLTEQLEDQLNEGETA